MSSAYVGNLASVKCENIQKNGHKVKQPVSEQSFLGQISVLYGVRAIMQRSDSSDRLNRQANRTFDKLLSLLY